MRLLCTQQMVIAKCRDGSTASFWVPSLVSALPRIVLQNSFLGCVQISPGALVRSLENHVGGRLNSLISNRLPLCVRYEAWYCRKSISTGKLRNFPAPSFLSFATQSRRRRPNRCATITD